MSAARKSSGASERLGRREKFVLTQIFLILDAKIGILHYEDLKNSLLINVDTVEEHRRRVREAERCRLALYRLEGRGYLEKVRRNDGSDPRCSLFEVTWKGVEAGRQAAREMLEEEVVNEAVRRLRVQGAEWATIKDIMDKVWEVSKEKNLFANRKEFEEYWTKRRLGLILKKHMNLKRSQRHINGKKKWGYIVNYLSL